jgi:hypothetical protein
VNGASRSLRLPESRAKRAVGFGQNRHVRR